MTDAHYMRRALTLARRGRPSPNPRVGAVVASGGRIVGEAYHHRAGQPHAEVLALRAAGEQARGADLYVTLEPCCHHGRTPPCTDAVIAAGISRVVAAMEDPDPKVSSRGFEKLRQAGIAVEVGLCEAEARRLNEAYIKHRTTGMPLVILKSAISLDGRIATRTGSSRWITGERARAYAHRIRSEADAIVIGAGTARLDNPALTARVGRKTLHPARVIVTASGVLPPDLAAVCETGECIIATCAGSPSESLRKLEAGGAHIIRLEQCGGRLSIAELMRQLAAMGCLTVLIEGGGELAASALEERVVDKVMFFYAPCIIGGREAAPAVGGTGVADVGSAVRLERLRIRRLGPDFLVEGYVV